MTQETATVTKIRCGVFETNSSSTHSLVISGLAPEDTMDTLPLDDQNRVVLGGGEFGWEVRDYYDAQTKADYLGLYVAYYPDDVISDGVTTLAQRLGDVIMAQTCCDGIVFRGDPRAEWESPDYGYIDHQSMESRNYHELFEDPEELRMFIFNPRSFLHTDNDNY